MKKKLLTALLVGAMALNITACGGSSDAAAPADNDQQTTTTDTAADDAADTEEDAVDVEDAAEAADTTEEEGFSLLDVTADLVDAALYAVDDDNTEYVITLFRDPDGYSYVSLMIVPQDGQGDVLCGAYDDSLRLQHGLDGVFCDVRPVQIQSGGHHCRGCQQQSLCGSKRKNPEY